MKVIPVEGYSDLARDPNTGAIININTTEMQQARERKAKRRQQQQQHQQLTEEVQSLKQELSELKSLLVSIVEKKHGKN